MEGVGLHTGATVRCEVHAAAGEGVWLETPAWRRALGPALAREARGVRCTALDGLSTLEHALGALVGLGVGGAALRCEGGELPALGGDALGWIEAIEGAGCAGRLPRFAPPAPIEVHAEGGWARWSPGVGEGLEVWYGVEFASSVIGRQELALTLDAATFRAEIAPARTFAVVSSVAELEALSRAAIGRGLGAADVLVAGPEGWLHGAPRFRDEPVRHKVLDLLGDLGLLGARPAGRVEVWRGGHRLHRMLARAASVYAARREGQGSRDA